MACNTLSIASSSVAGVTAYAPLSSASAPFVVSSAPAMLAPLSSASTLKPLSISCSLSEMDTPSNSSTGKALLTGLVAVGAALSVFTADTVAPPAAFAASGPGSSGAERTAQKAQDLLKAADKLNIEDAPKRFGPGRVNGGNQDAGKTAQEAGGKAISQIQDGISSIAGTLSGKQGEVKGAAENAASQAQGKVDEVTGNSGPGGVFSQVRNKIDEVSGNSGPGGVFSKAQNKVDEVTGNSGPGGVVSQARDKVDEATGNSGPGGLFSSIQNTVQGIKDSVSQKDADAKRTLDQATNSVQSSVQ